MAVDQEPARPAPPAPPAKKQIPLPAAIALLVVALAALFWFVLKPMFFAPAPTDMYEGPVPAPPGTPGAPGMPGSPAPPSPVPPPPGGQAAPAPAPGGQPAPAPAATPAAAPAELPKPVPQAGEIVVTGTVKAFAPGTNQFTMEAVSIELPGKGSVPLSPARNKLVMLTNTTVIKAAGATATRSAIKAGASVSAVGKNRGEGASLVARRVVL